MKRGFGSNPSPGELMRLGSGRHGLSVGVRWFCRNRAGTGSPSAAGRTPSLAALGPLRTSSVSIGLHWTVGGVRSTVPLAMVGRSPALAARALGQPSARATRKHKSAGFMEGRPAPPGRRRTEPPIPRDMGHASILNGLWARPTFGQAPFIAGAFRRRQHR